MEPDVADWFWAVSPLPLVEPVEEPDAEEPAVEVESWPPVELLAAADALVWDALVSAEVLDPSLLPHAVSERPAAATTRARADIFLTRIGTPGSGVVALAPAERALLLQRRPVAGRAL
jgi:hypothetical protein